MKLQNFCILLGRGKSCAPRALQCAGCITFPAIMKRGRALGVLSSVVIRALSVNSVDLRQVLNANKIYSDLLSSLSLATRLKFNIPGVNAAAAPAPVVAAAVCACLRRY